MATSPSPRLELERPLANHGFSRAEHYNNLTLIDGYPGTFICTSGTRPGGWGTANEGMVIWETDTDLRWRWDGTKFVRFAPLGLLNVSTVTANASTGATSPVQVITTAVTVPAFTVGSTAKRIKIEASWYAIDNGTDTTLGAAEVSIMRDTTVIMKQLLRGRPTTDTEELNWGTGGSIVVFDDPTAGAESYHLAINSVAAVGGTTTLRATATTPAQLAVSEVGV